MANSNKTKTALIIVTVASTIICVCPLILWMQVVNANATATQEQKQKLFLQKLPFTNLNTVSYLMLLFAIVAAVAAAMWRKRCAATEKIIATVVLICFLPAYSFVPVSTDVVNLSNSKVVHEIKMRR